MSEKDAILGQEEETTVTLTLDDGSEMECLVLNIFTVENQDYIALMPMEALESEEGGEVFLYRFEETEDGELNLGNIENDEEFEMVSEAFDEFLDEREFDEVFGDE